MRVCVVGAPGKLGRHMVRHALGRGFEVVGVCRQESVPKLDAFAGRIRIGAGATNDRDVIRRAVAPAIVGRLTPSALAHAPDA